MLKAGLPNITGTISGQLPGGASIWISPGTGAFYMTSEEQSEFSVPAATISSTRYSNTGIVFSATRSSDIFGASDTVQPPTLQLIPQIRF